MKKIKIMPLLLSLLLVAVMTIGCGQEYMPEEMICEAESGAESEVADSTAPFRIRRVSAVPLAVRGNVHENRESESSDTYNESTELAVEHNESGNTEDSDNEKSEPAESEHKAYNSKAKYINKKEVVHTELNKNESSEIECESSENSNENSNEDSLDLAAAMSWNETSGNEDIWYDIPAELCEHKYERQGYDASEQMDEWICCRCGDWYYAEPETEESEEWYIEMETKED